MVRHSPLATNICCARRIQCIVNLRSIVSVFTRTYDVCMLLPNPMRQLAHETEEQMILSFVIALFVAQYNATYTTKMQYCDTWSVWSTDDVSMLEDVDVMRYAGTDQFRFYAVGRYGYAAYFTQSGALLIPIDTGISSDITCVDGGISHCFAISGNTVLELYPTPHVVLRAEVDLNDIDWYSQNDVCVVGEDGAIFLSSDAGNTWETKQAYWDPCPTDIPDIYSVTAIPSGYMSGAKYILAGENGYVYYQIRNSFCPIQSPTTNGVGSFFWLNNDLYAFTGGGSGVLHWNNVWDWEHTPVTLSFSVWDVTSSGYDATEAYATGYLYGVGPIYWSNDGYDWNSSDLSGTDGPQSGIAVYDSEGESLRGHSVGSYASYRSELSPSASVSTVSGDEMGNVAIDPHHGTVELVSSTDQGCTVDIFSIDGRMIDRQQIFLYSGQEYMLNCSELVLGVNGIYFMQITSDNGENLGNSTVPVF